MTWSQRGIYRELLDWQWIEGSIPSDPAEAAQLLPMAELADVQAVLSMAFQPLEAEAKRSVSGRLERERSILVAFSKVAVERGKAGAAAVSRGNDGKFTASSGSERSASPPLTTGSPSPPPSPSPVSSPSEKKARKRAELDVGGVLGEFSDLNTADVRAAVDAYLEGRRERRQKPQTARGLRLGLSKLAPYGALVAATAIRDAEEGGWLGFHAPNHGNNGKPEESIDDMLAKARKKTA